MRQTAAFFLLDIFIQWRNCYTCSHLSFHFTVHSYFGIRMRHVAAYMLAVMGGNENPTADDIKTILSSVGVEADAEALDLVIEKLKGKNIEELIEEGMAKLASMPTGGSGCGTAPNDEKLEKPDHGVDDDTDDDDNDDTDEEMVINLFD